MKIVAFGHRKRVGKDTAAKFLITYLKMTRKGINIQKRGFADKVKDIAYQLYSSYGLMSGDIYEDPACVALREIPLPLIRKSPRQIWIGVGNGLRSAVDDDTWLNYLFSSESGCDLLVIKDLRFPVEANGILDRGGFVFRIDRDSEPKVTDGADDPLENYDRWTGIIKNNSSLDNLHSEMVNIAERLLS